MKARIKFKEIFRLKKMLDDGNIPYEFSDRTENDIYDDYGNIIFSKGYQICYPCKKFICSVIENTGSYGNKDDKLEIMGLLTKEEKKFDSVVGWLTAEEVYLRIKNHYENERT